MAGIKLVDLGHEFTQRFRLYVVYACWKATWRISEFKFIVATRLCNLQDTNTNHNHKLDPGILALRIRSRRPWPRSAKSPINNSPTAGASARVQSLLPQRSISEIPGIVKKDWCSFIYYIKHLQTNGRSPGIIAVPNKYSVSAEFLTRYTSTSVFEVLHVVKPGNPSSIESSQRHNGKHAEHCYSLW
jgi:hypothetical protein